MQEKTLSVFVDESGRFQHLDAMSRFYIVGLVLHDQSVEIGERVSALDRDWRGKYVAEGRGGTAPAKREKEEAACLARSEAGR